MNKYFLHHIRFGDFEVTKEHFECLVNLASTVDSKGFSRYKVVKMVDDRDPDIIYYYIWCRNSDFFYLGYVERSE